MMHFLQGHTVYAPHLLIKVFAEDNILHEDLDLRDNDGRTKDGYYGNQAVKAIFSDYSARTSTAACILDFRVYDEDVSVHVPMFGKSSQWFDLLRKQRNRTKLFWTLPRF